MYTVAREEGRDGGVKKFGAIVSLHGHNGKVKLGASIGNKINYGVGRVGFPSKREGPHIVRVVINDNKIIFKTRITKNRRCPQITMN